MALVIDCLVRLGAKPDVIEAAEWVVHQSSHSTIQACDKYEIVHRLVSLVTAFARSVLYSLIFSVGFETYCEILVAVHLMWKKFPTSCSSCSLLRWNRPYRLI